MNRLASLSPCRLATGAAAFFLVGCQNNYQMPPPKPAPPDVVSAGLRISLLLSPQPVRQMDATTLTVHLSNAHSQPAAGAAVSADLVMPGMDMGKNTVALTPQGAGTYGGTARFPMDGGWRVTVTVTKGAQRSVQTFPVQVH